MKLCTYREFVGNRLRIRSSADHIPHGAAEVDPAASPTSRFPFLCHQQVCRAALIAVFWLLSVTPVPLSAEQESCEPPSSAAKPNDRQEAARRGYEFMTKKAYLPPDFDQQVFDELWKTWPDELQEKARNASPEERRAMTFSRYGLIEAAKTAEGKGRLADMSMTGREDGS